MNRNTMRSLVSRAASLCVAALSACAIAALPAEAAEVPAKGQSRTVDGIKSRNTSETIVVTKDGCEPLTNFPRQLFRI